MYSRFINSGREKGNENNWYYTVYIIRKRRIYLAFPALLLLGIHSRPIDDPVVVPNKNGRIFI